MTQLPEDRSKASPTERSVSNEAWDAEDDEEDELEDNDLDVWDVFIACVIVRSMGSRR
jgi:hypothetical protein